MEEFGLLMGQKMAIQTVFLGGGTPSTWPDTLILDMFAKLKDVFFFADAQEVTIEVNPGTVRREQLALWREIGINRLSIGVQSLNNEVLQSLNRYQTRDDVYFLLNNASPLFDNISVDLIVGLPGVVEQEWQLLLDEVIRWPISHISIYCLMLHEQTKLYYQHKKGDIDLPDDDEVAAMYEYAVNMLVCHGFEQYEVSNFARPGYESKHNKVYWSHDLYKGFGLGACSFDGVVRSQNIQSLMEYVDAVENKKTTTVFEERLTDDQKRLEIIMLGLRTTYGVSCAQMLDELSDDKKEHCKQHIEWLKQHNFMREHNGRIHLTPKGMVVEHEIVARFFAEKK